MTPFLPSLKQKRELWLGDFYYLENCVRELGSQQSSKQNRASGDVIYVEIEDKSELKYTFCLLPSKQQILSVEQPQTFNIHVMSNFSKFEIFSARIKVSEFSFRN